MRNQKGSPRSSRVEAGLIQILALGAILAALVGLGAGLYLIQHPTNILPKAAESGSARDNLIPNIPIQIPSFLAGLIPTPAPASPQPSTEPSPIPSSSPTPTPTSPTPSPTPTPTPTPIPTPSPSASGGPTPTLPAISSPITPAPTGIQRDYRVSFDPNFSTLIDTGDNGIFGDGNDKTINITLSDSDGPKPVYVQFFENGSWTPATPIVASVTLRGYRTATEAVPEITQLLPGISVVERRGNSVVYSYNGKDVEIMDDYNLNLQHMLEHIQKYTRPCFQGTATTQISAVTQLLPRVSVVERRCYSVVYSYNGKNVEITDDYNLTPQQAAEHIQRYSAISPTPTPGVH